MKHVTTAVAMPALSVSLMLTVLGLYLPDAHAGSVASRLLVPVSGSCHNDRTGENVIITGSLLVKTKVGPPCVQPNPCAPQLVVKVKVDPTTTGTGETSGDPYALLGGRFLLKTTPFAAVNTVAVTPAVFMVAAVQAQPNPCMLRTHLTFDSNLVATGGVVDVLDPDNSPQCQSLSELDCGE